MASQLHLSRLADSGARNGEVGVRRELVQNGKASGTALLFDFRTRRVGHRISTQTLEGSLKSLGESPHITTGVLQKATSCWL